MAEGIRVEGLDEIFKKFDKLDQVAGTKAASRAITKGAAELRKAARRNIKALDDPNTPESIYKNITSRKWRYKKDRKYVGASVGVLGGAKGYAAASGEFKGKGEDNPGGDTYYWRFAELGTKTIPAKHTITNSLTEAAPAAMAAFTAEATKIINEI